MNGVLSDFLYTVPYYILHGIFSDNPKTGQLELICFMQYWYYFFNSIYFFFFAMAYLFNH